MPWEKQNSKEVFIAQAEDMLSEAKEQIAKKKKKLSAIKDTLWERLAIEEKKKALQEIGKEIDNISDTIQKQVGKHYQNQLPKIERMKNDVLDTIAVFKKELKETENDIREAVKKAWKQDIDIAEEEDGKKEKFWESKRGKGVKYGAIWWGIVSLWFLVRNRWKKRKAKKQAENNDESGSTPAKKEKGFREKTWNWVLWALGLTWVWVFVASQWDKITDWFNTLFRWKTSDVTDRAKDQVESTLRLKESNPEKFEKYKGLGKYIDEQYDTMMAREITSWFGGMSIADGYKKYIDEKAITFEDFKATVPMCIDNEFDSVKALLSEWGYYGYSREKSMVEFKHKLSNWADKKVEQVFWPFMWSLISFKKYNENKELWRKDKVTTWLKEWKYTEREEELNLFFRQYVKVVNYLQEKKHQLIDKIAEEKYARYPGEYDSVKDAMNDREWREHHVYDDPRYKNFYEGKIHKGIDILKDQELFDSDLSDSMKAKVGACDSTREKIIGSEKAFNTLEHNTDKIPDIANNTIKDIESNFDETWTYFYFTGFHVWINSKQNNIQEFLEKSWLLTVKRWIVDSLKEYKDKQKEWSLTPEDIKGFKNLVNEYFVMKKEVFIAAQALQDIKSDNFDPVERSWQVMSTTVSSIMKQTVTSCESFGKGRDHYLDGYFQATAWLLVAWWMTIIAGKISGMKKIEKAGKIIIKSTAPVVMVKSFPNISRRADIFTKMPSWMLRHTRYNTEEKGWLLYKDVLEGKISIQKAERVLGEWMEIVTAQGKVQKITKVKTLIHEMMEVKDSDTARCLYVLLTEEGSEFLKNKSLRELIFESQEVWKTKRPLRWFRKMKYSFSKNGLSVLNAVDVFMNDAKGFGKLNSNQRGIYNYLVNSADFKGLLAWDIENVLSNIKYINISKMNKLQINYLALYIKQQGGLKELVDENKVKALVQTIEKMSDIDVYKSLGTLKWLEKEKTVLLAQKWLKDTTQELPKMLQALKEGVLFELPESIIVKLDKTIASLKNIGIDIAHLDDLKKILQGKSLGEQENIWRLFKELSDDEISKVVASLAKDAKLKQNIESILLSTKYLSEDEVVIVMTQAMKEKDIMHIFKSRLKWESRGVNMDRLRKIENFENYFKGMSRYSRDTKKLKQIQWTLRELVMLDDGAFTLLNKFCASSDDVEEVIQLMGKFGLNGMGEFRKFLEWLEKERDITQALKKTTLVLNATEIENIKKIQFLTKYLDDVADLSRTGKFVSHIDEMMNIGKFISKLL